MAYINPDKLKELKDKGILSEEDFLEHKKNLAFRILHNHKEASARNGVVYILLAFFLGTLGLHNFYAGYFWRGLFQLLLTLFSWAFMFIPLLFVAFWVFLELLFVNKSANGKAFRGNGKLILLLRFIAVLWLGIAFSYSKMFYEIDYESEGYVEEAEAL